MPNVVRRDQQPFEGCFATRTHTSSSRGYSENQDRGVMAQFQHPQDGKVTLYGVFDGHSGDQVSELLRTRFPEHLSAFVSQFPSIQNVSTVAFEEAFSSFDRQLWQKWQQGQLDDSGSTAIVVLITKHEVIFLNLGDSVGLIYQPSLSSPHLSSTRARSGPGGVKYVTQEHTPSDPAETQRIINSGGIVTAEGRINGRINVSRGFGDFTLKYSQRDQNDIRRVYNPRGPVSALPTVTRFPRAAFSGMFLMLFSDGLSHAVSIPQLSEYLARQATQSEVCNSLIDSYIDQSGDDMTIMVTRIP